MQARGWDVVDVVLVTGDAYVDHPSFGVALISRWLEAHGYRVAILSQPPYQTSEAFREFGRPRLFFGITAGNLDSVVANYSGNARVRDEDSFSSDGNPYRGEGKQKALRRRPDRATILYANLARAAYPEVPIVLGGLEASLRRFIHYDFKQAKLRGSILTDAKADLLVFGMGERAVLEIAARLKNKGNLTDIPGTCERLKELEKGKRIFPLPPELLPSWHEIEADLSLFLKAEIAVERLCRAGSPIPILQQQQGMWVLQHRPADPLSVSELDRLYSLPFTRLPHPNAGDVPAYRMIRHSITIVRGCPGNCSFCAISRHQGGRIISRSQASVIEEVKQVRIMPDFGGTISDLGGPTANLYGVSCSKPSCRRYDCLYPVVCRHLRVDEDMFLDLLLKVIAIPGIKNVFISSGLRMELLLRTPGLLKQIVSSHVPGMLKIAPEHTEEHVLRLMHKGNALLLPEFLKACRNILGIKGRPLLFSPYIMTSHPGCTLNDMKLLKTKIKRLGLSVRKFQDFTPTPGTISTAMYVTGLDRDTEKPIPVVRKVSERRAQRLILEGM